MFNDTIEKTFTLSFNSWFADKKPVDTGLEFQVNKGSVQNINSLKKLKLAHQSLDKIGVLNKGNKISIFDNVKVRNNFVEIDYSRHLKNSVNINYGQKENLDQY